MNPRIQVEHTVTEEITDVDLVQSQMRIASGESLADLGLSQEIVRINGAALQCRITTEDPANGFRPDTGTITAYRSAGGAGVRLDGGTVDTGVEISAHFDSMLVKLTCRGRSFEAAVARARRALAEFRIRGVSTNIPFLQAVLEDPDFIAGDVSTAFIEERPGLLTTHAPADRGTKLLRWLAEVTVNKPWGDAPTQLDPGVKRPVGVDLTVPSPQGSRQRLLELGPEGFAADLRSRVRTEVTDTTFRDAHQSLLATRVRTKDLLRIAPYVGRMTPELLSVECWGGATYDVALRFLAEDPWERLAALRYNMPGLCLQMLLRGRNTVGYTPYPTKVTTSFVAEAAAVGIDIFRIFDALNDIDQMRPAIDAVRETGTTVAEVALCYTADLTNPGETLYTLDYYLRLAEQIVDAGAHVLAIKDMAGLLRPPAAKTLVTALRERFDLPVHLHTHDTAGGQLATLMAAVDAGRRRGRRGQRPDGRDHVAGAGLGAGRRAGAHRACDEPGPAGRDGPRAVLGGGPQGLRAVRVRSGRADRARLRPRDPRRPAVEPPPAGRRARPRGEVRADRGHVRGRQPILGRPTKVTPSSKVVGDLALQLVAVGADPKEFEENPQAYDIPDSVIGFLGGELGDPPGGWPEPFRTRRWPGGPCRCARPSWPRRTRRSSTRPGSTRQAALNRLLFPGPTKEFLRLPRDVRQRRPARHPRLPLRPAAGRGARRPDRAGRQPDPRPVGHR